ncbi:acetyltransferase [Tremella mesenterica]|uniref:Acetyltransferase n=1 Tax=Tremella mesenterica TaxID=5217 RepID=A0A4Q1BS18_TREME|nr:uncharacterized protein TREMEDRAFT_41579 [Tremella mesenterica DSM 1558]EIW72186.1 hypothetical protein TREMEDRAFT_41579 [Tremella mesenterica DSM 1558]RXK40781.1 acetyltransferase [Tremella mesenterica]
MAVVYTTTGTVSSPLDLDHQVKGEYQQIQLNGNSKKGMKLKPKVTLTSLTVNNSGTLRKINSVVIPIVYSDKFYKDVLSSDLEEVNKLIYYGDIPVGACCCRFDNLNSTNGEKPPTLVILTLAVLAPYRSLGLGRALLLHALKEALHPTTPPPPIPNKDKPTTRGQVAPSPPRKSVKRALVHVQEGNEGAKRFYERLGFKEIERVENFYSKLEPRHAILMVLDDIVSTLGETLNGS